MNEFEELMNKIPPVMKSKVSDTIRQMVRKECHAILTEDVPRFEDGSKAHKEMVAWAKALYDLDTYLMKLQFNRS